MQLIARMQLLSKQPGYHRPAPSAPAALPWQQGVPASQHTGWDLPPAPQFNQQQAQQLPVYVRCKSRLCLDCLHLRTD